MSIRRRFKKIFRKTKTRLSFDDVTLSAQKTARAGASTVFVGPYTYGYKSINVRQWNEGCDLHIGAFCSIGEGLKVFLGGNHHAGWITTYPIGHFLKDELSHKPIPDVPETNGDVTIGNDVWVGESVTIMSGVTIGDGAILAANATVTRDVGPYEIWGGTPAKLIRLRFAAPIVDRLVALSWWSLPHDEILRIEPILTAEPQVDVLDDILRRCGRAPVSA